MQFIVVFPNEMRVIVATPEEVIALYRAAKLAGISLAEPSTPKPERTSESSSSRSWEALCKLVVDDKHKVEHKILAAVKGHPKGISVTELMRALSIDTSGGFGARIAGVGRLAKAAGYQAHELLVPTGKGGQRSYLPGDALASGNLPPVPEPGGKR